MVLQAFFEIHNRLWKRPRVRSGSSSNSGIFRTLLILFLMRPILQFMDHLFYCVHIYHSQPWNLLSRFTSTAFYQLTENDRTRTLESNSSKVRVWCICLLNIITFFTYQCRLKKVKLCLSFKIKAKRPMIVLMEILLLLVFYRVFKNN